MTNPKVTIIPATKKLFTGTAIQSTEKRKVAAYARVSTDSEEQLTSYEAQVDYYTKYIQSKANWEFVGVYTDEGISALNTKRRDGFNTMITDALNGKIDLIVTKSVSRFARNTVDSLTTVRRLKDKGVEVYFEKENIYTLDGKGELLITIMSSLAQEESRSISENVTWGQRKRFADGKVSLPYKHFLGYKKGENGLPEIVEEQAVIVKRIYKLFLDGKTPTWIARHLTEQEIPTPGGKTVWQSSTVESILTNEKYKGSALLQKQFTVNFLDKKMKVNEGEVPQYYVEESHPAIISTEIWNAVQAELTKRKTLNVAYNCRSPFSNSIVCGDCGAFYGPKVWHSTDQYRRIVWQCNSKFKDRKGCKTPHLTEEKIQALFLTAFSILFADRKRIIEQCRELQTLLTDTTVIDNELKTVADEMEIVEELVKRYVYENANAPQSQTEYLKKYNDYIQHYDNLKNKRNELLSLKESKLNQRDSLGRFMFTLMELDDLPITFSDTLWTNTVETMTIFHDGDIVFKFKCGKEIKV